MTRQARPEYQRRWREEHRAQIRAVTHRWYQENRERIVAVRRLGRVLVKPGILRPYIEQGQAAEIRFWAKVRKTEGCWEWTGFRNRQGYGRFNLAHRRPRMAHRVSWEWENGPIPDGLQIDHLCRNHACVRPSHLEPVTGLVNVRRGRNARSETTHCPQRHPYDALNTVVGHRGNGRVFRMCRECIRAGTRRRRAAARA